MHITTTNQRPGLRSHGFSFDMQSTISTPRLKLTLITSADRGTQEFAELHELRSDQQTTWWTYASSSLLLPLSPNILILGHSQRGQSKTPEDTEIAIKDIFPTPSTPDSEKSYRIAYLIHETSTARFIGLLTLRSITPASLSLPPSFSPSAHILELAYLFLPSAWHCGFATEAVGAVLTASRKAEWRFPRVYLRAVVSVENGGSLKVRLLFDREGTGLG
jgi:RimJ/RimL family protein N-acetyltransferase